MQDKQLFIYKKVIFDEKALNYPLGKRLYKTCKDAGIETWVEKRAVLDVPKEITPAQMYREAKKSLLVGIRTGSRLEPCKPSADFQLPLVSGCPGMCEYCYLHTRKGPMPTQKLYVNVEDIFSNADKIAQETFKNTGEKTSFELAATSDPLPFETFSGIITEAIKHFAGSDISRIRLSTKFADVDTLLDLDHKNCLDVRFSVNAESVAKKFEHNVPPPAERIAAAGKMSKAGYPVGFMLAPVMLFDNWQEEYKACLDQIQKEVERPTFEVIAHRFTPNAKEAIESIFNGTVLDMNQELRTYKRGQFGYGKYTYTKEQYKDIREFFKSEIGRRFGEDKLLYIV